MKNATVRQARIQTTLVSVLVGTALLATTAPCALAYDRDAPSIVTKNPTVGARGLYVVQDGDTLWDLSEVFLGLPWNWPSLWSYNPQVTNPHWIYPGDALQIRAPQPLSQTTIVWSDTVHKTDKTDLQILARYVGYLPDRAFESSGQIKHSRESVTNFGQYHEVYLEFGKDMRVRRGDRFTIYRDLGKVKHPITKDVIGRRIKHLGVAKVLDADSHFVKALILQSYEEIQRGDLITSIFPHSWIVAPEVGEEEVLATLADIDDPVKFAGQYQYVYIDKGRNEGVRRGNRFIVERRGDGTWYDGPPRRTKMDDFPWENVGEVMVVEAFEETSLGIVSRSIRALERGDRLHMPKGY
ncbi:MAG: LysM peptidoglycan-binding domain-containing protein [Myxococcota bacterium]